MKLTGKNILISGGNRGIGLAIATKAASLKMNIHLLCRSQSDEVEVELKKLGAANVKTWLLDMSRPEDIESFAKSFKESDFSCDILVNNAGQLTGGLLEEQPTENIYKMFQVNIVGLTHLTKLMLPEMLKLDEAKIINNASVAGLMHLPCASTYSASKAAVIAFTECLRNELLGTNVTTLLMVTPGVKTRMYDEIPKLYSGHMDLKLLTSISSEKWIEQVFHCIERDKPQCWPSGQPYFGVKIAQHFPGLLSRIVKPYFKR